MIYRILRLILAASALAVVLVYFLRAQQAPPTAPAAGEYAKHLKPLADLTVAVAQAMPADKYTFKPHPDSMDFGQLMVHIASANFAFCQGLKDAAPSPMPQPEGKDGIVKFLGNSFHYCSGVLDSATPGQMNAVHNSPDGNLPGRDLLLAMYIHVAHHRGQAEIYLRDNGIVPPSYRI
ncbi:MAG TPA: DinB family protein [Terracidiphilus sp.]|nr:DinB family protein [Terracidiphilus sp.]